MVWPKGCFWYKRSIDCKIKINFLCMGGCFQNPGCATARSQECLAARVQNARSQNIETLSNNSLKLKDL